MVGDERGKQDLCWKSKLRTLTYSEKQAGEHVRDFEEAKERARRAEDQEKLEVAANLEWQEE